MKYFLATLIFLLVLVSCQKEDGTSNDDLKFVGCLKDEEPISSEGCQVYESGTLFIQHCEVIHSEYIFSLSEEAKGWLPFYCYSKGDTISFLNQTGQQINFSISRKGRGKISTSEVGKCEADSSKTIVRCRNIEYASVYIESELFEQSIAMRMWPNFETDSSGALKLGAHLDIYNEGGNMRNNVFSFPVDWENLIKPFYYDFQYLPEIEILEKTFYEVYTHEEELEGFYTQIYYNKEFGIVSFVDETGEQWRLDL